MFIRGIHDMLVYFVGNDESVEFFGKPGDDEQFFFGKHFSGGISRIAENKRLGMLFKGPA